MVARFTLDWALAVSALRDPVRSDCRRGLCGSRGVKASDALEKATKSAQMAGDNAWMLTNSALVLMMTSPGLASAVVLWPGAAQERARHDDAQLRPDGIGNDHMGRGRLQSGVFGGVALPRRLATRVSKRCRRRSQPRLRGDHPSAN